MRDIHPFRSVLFATAAVVAAASPGAAWAQTRAFSVPSQPAGTGVAALARQADTQILISADDAAGKTTNTVRGNYTTEQAIERLLDGTGLVARRTGPDSYSVFDPPAGSALDKVAGDTEGQPEILVTARRNWSLNTGIKRTRDDSQPFVVFDQEQIKRTGATNLERFLADYLTSNATAGTGETAQENFFLGESSVNLRGLGDRETLILVDGRRQPGLNNGSGDLEQTPLANIPLASIERIEVLASSAAGIYGVGATGGVINIILRRDYNGREITLNYADTTDFKAPDARIDLTLGQNVEGGRTNLSFSGSYRKSDPLTRAEREKFISGGQQFAFRNDPNFFNTPPLGRTPNIRSDSGTLTLDEEYGGEQLRAGTTFVPVGFRGVALDGVAPLVANAGRYDFDFPNIAGNIPGGRNPVIYGAEQISGTLAVRREMNSWLRLYAEAAGSISKSTSLINVATESIFLDGDSPNNPFQEEIVVSVPQYGYDTKIQSKNSQLRLVGGAIVKLPGEWQGAIDVAYSRDWFDGDTREAGVTSKSLEGLTDGTLNPLRDIALAPFVFERDQVLYPSLDAVSSVLDAQLKLAGPLPFRLPGGKPILSLNLARSHQKFGEVFTVDTDPTFANITYSPPRSETIYSAYGEIRAPLVGEANDISFVRQFEITVAARYERYTGVGSDTRFECFFAPDGFPAGTVDIANCDPDTLDLPREKLTNGHFDPSISLRWQVVRDLTLRASYATGYLPPRLGQLIRVPTDFVVVRGTDPQRGGEQVGEDLGGGVGFIDGFIGGNPDVDNEESKSLTAGAIVTPRFIPGLRVSADYTRIRKKNNFAQPIDLLNGPNTVEGQEAFETFLRLFPDRVTRGPASDGFAVGPITSIDASFINIAGTKVEVIDFAADYSRPLGGGTLDLTSSATLNLESSSQAFPDSESIDFSGVGPRFGAGAFGAGALKWRGVGSVRWSNDRLSIGWRGRYFDGYFLAADRTVFLDQGSARVRSQFYQDVFGSYRFDGGFNLRAGVNNLFNRKPPYVSGGYSGFGDPRLANFYLALSKAF